MPMFPLLSIITELPMLEEPVNLAMLPEVPLPVTVWALPLSAVKPIMTNTTQMPLHSDLPLLFRFEQLTWGQCGHATRPAPPFASDKRRQSPSTEKLSCFGASRLVLDSDAARQKVSLPKNPLRGVSATAAD